MGKQTEFEEISEQLLDDSYKVDEPKMYKVLMHNDNYTPMEFVVMILVKVFHMPPDKAQDIMFTIHNKGIATCGVYTYDIAETKTNQVHSIAERKGYPLKTSLEPSN